MSEQSIISIVVAVIGVIGAILAARITSRGRALQSLGTSTIELHASQARRPATAQDQGLLREVRIRLLFLFAIGGGLYFYGLFMLLRTGEWGYVIEFGTIGGFVAGTSAAIAERLMRLSRPQSN